MLALIAIALLACVPAAQHHVTTERTLLQQGASLAPPGLPDALPIRPKTLVLGVDAASGWMEPSRRRMGAGGPGQVMITDRAGGLALASLWEEGEIGLGFSAGTPLTGIPLASDVVYERTTLLGGGRIWVRQETRLGEELRLSGFLELGLTPVAGIQQYGVTVTRTDYGEITEYSEESEAEPFEALSRSVRTGVALGGPVGDRAWPWVGAGASSYFLIETWQKEVERCESWDTYPEDWSCSTEGDVDRGLLWQEILLFTPAVGFAWRWDQVDAAAQVWASGPLPEDRFYYGASASLRLAFSNQP